MCSEKSSVAWCKNLGLLLVRGWNGNCSSQCKFEIRRSRKQKLPAGAGEGYKHEHTYWQNGKRRKMKLKINEQISKPKQNEGKRRSSVQLCGKTTKCRTGTQVYEIKARKNQMKL